MLMNWVLEVKIQVVELMALSFEQLKHRILNPASVDKGRKVIPNPATSTEVALCEQVLGFPLPEVLRRFYLEIGNGGFGPGHQGIFGLPNAAINFGGHSVLEWYVGLRSRHQVDLPEWPQGWLPICGWGCSIMSSIDCTKAQAPIIRNDPNWDFDDICNRLQKTQILADSGRVFEASWIEAQSLEEWIQAWIDGKDLFHLAYP